MLWSGIRPRENEAWHGWASSTPMASMARHHPQTAALLVVPKHNAAWPLRPRLRMPGLQKLEEMSRLQQGDIKTDVRNPSSPFFAVQTSEVWFLPCPRAAGLAGGSKRRRARANRGAIDDDNLARRPALKKTGTQSRTTIDLTRNKTFWVFRLWCICFLLPAFVS